MLRIGLISDSHSYIDDQILEHLKKCDEIWHAGDIGAFDVVDQIEALGIKFRAVYGNIDDQKIRREFPLNLIFMAEDVKVFMTHIGGYPGRYYSRIPAILNKEKPKLYICGHSHICKVIPDHKYQLLHMNAGAIGHIGFHTIRTMLLFDINKDKIENLRVVELGKRGRV